MSRLSRGARRPLGPLKFSTVVVLLVLEEWSSMPRSPDRPPCGPCARVASLTGLSSSGSRFLAASGRRGLCPDRPGSKVTHFGPPRHTGPLGDLRQSPSNRVSPSPRFGSVTEKYSSERSPAFLPSRDGVSAMAV